VRAIPKKLIVVVPYRDRATNLQRFVPHMRDHLRDIRHEIVVVEQAGRQPFNKGALFNVGFSLHKREEAYFSFHDVDLLPEDSSCDYSYPSTPTHLSRYCSQYGYAVPYDWLCGGVMLFDKNNFIRINGYSNQYRGWGSEDDDLYFRLVHYGYQLQHRPGRYTSLPHPPAIDVERFQANKERLYSGYAYASDGLSSLRSLVRSTDRHPGYTRYLVDVDAPAGGGREETRRAGPASTARSTARLRRWSRTWP
jgi:beta-1,4-galactosyltransferase 1